MRPRERATLKQRRGRRAPGQRVGLIPRERATLKPREHVTGRHLDDACYAQRETGLGGTAGTSATSGVDGCS